MIDYTLAELEKWNERIEEVIKSIPLDYYEQQFEIVNYDDMLCYEAYSGMPSHYPHWSLGKSYERLKQFYQCNLVGLPYEMVINSDPCIAYLMADNSLLLQILTMAHVYAHNDFFKNNRLFKRDTRAELTVEIFKSHANRVRQYIQNPHIGSEKVERILDAAHAIRFQTLRNGSIKIPKDQSENSANPIPYEYQEDLLGFLREKGHLEDWERDLISIVREETLYFIPQIETKIMNEGWASYWHYYILNQLQLPQKLHWEFLKRHNMVVRPWKGEINPYFLGFKLFSYYANQPNGLDLILSMREQERDSSFIRRYLTYELCEELHLFTYNIVFDHVVIANVPTDNDWMKIRDQLANQCGLGSIPIVIPQKVENDHTLILEHIYDGRELELDYAKETLKYIGTLWGSTVKLYTNIDNRQKTLIYRDGNVTLTEYVR